VTKAQNRTNPKWIRALWNWLDCIYSHKRSLFFAFLHYGQGQRLWELGAAGVRKHGYSVLSWRRLENVTNKTQFYNFQGQKFIKWLLFGWHYHYYYHDFSTPTWGNGRTLMHIHSSPYQSQLPGSTPPPTHTHTITPILCSPPQNYFNSPHHLA